MTLDIVSRRRAIEHVTVAGSLEELTKQLSDPEQIAAIFSTTFARLRSTQQHEALSREPRVQIVDASENRSEWLVWLADDEKYYGIAELRALPEQSSIELRVSIDYEPAQSIIARLKERVADEEVEQTLRADLAAFKRRFAAAGSGESN